MEISLQNRRRTLQEMLRTLITIVKINCVCSSLYKDGVLAKEVTYTYDALGRRIEKTIINHEDNQLSYTKRFAYDGNEILFELNSENSITKTYTHSTLRTDDPLAVDKAGETLDFIKDGLGSITDITNDEGFKVQHYEYSAYGELKAITDASGVDISQNPILDPHFTYTGREFDTESGLYYYRARYYDSKIGRFLQVDPDSGKMINPITHINKHAYVGNNPINLIDPSGMKFLGSSGLHIGIGMIAASPLAGGYSKLYKKDPKLAIRALVYVGIIGGSVVLTGGASLVPIVIGASVGATVGYFASGRNVNGAIRGALIGGTRWRTWRSCWFLCG